MSDQTQEKNDLLTAGSGELENLRQSLKRVVTGQSVDPRVQVRFDASDVVQNTLLDLHEKGELDRILALPPDQQKKVLKTVAAHDLCDAIKKQRKGMRDVARERPLAAGDDSSSPHEVQQSPSAPVGLRLEDATTPSQAAVRNETSEALQLALSRLPEKHRIAVVGFWFQGLSHQQVADLNGWSLQKQHNYFYKGLNRIRELLEGGGAS